MTRRETSFTPSGAAAKRLRVVVAAALAATGVATAVASPAAADRPALVVQVVIEGLTANGLETLAPAFGNDGFRRLAAEGVELVSVNYGPFADAASAATIISTGAEPRVSGIDGATVFDPLRRTARAALTDSALSVSLSAPALSPAALNVTTLSDELAIANSGIGRIYSIGADLQTSLLMAGHAASNAFGLSDADGSWTGVKGYYNDIPGAVAARNIGAGALKQRIDTIAWTPLRNPKTYPGVNPTKAAYPFKHVFARNNPDRYRAFKASARGNSEVTDIAGALIQGLGNTGGDGVTQMVNIVYTLAPYPFSKDPDPAIETADAYIRLDADLARLFEAIEKHGPGMERTLMLVAGVPAPPATRRDDERFRIPYGRFSARKAQSLLNMYLMARYGEGDWVAGYHNRRIHLNRSLIARQGLDEAETRREAAAFLSRMAGVTSALTLDELRARADLEPMLRNVAPQRAADIFLTIAPGWEIVDAEDSTGGSVPRPQVSRATADITPAFIIGNGLEPGLITQTVDARALAPAMSRLLRIRAPNGAALPPPDGLMRRRTIK